MLYKIDCKADIAEQDASYPTYKYIDCDLHINANDANFYGRLIDCTLAIVTTLVTACKNWNQGIRTTVTIDDVDVTDALVGAINIQHNKNMISTFSLSLGDTQYSPLANSNIASNKVVVITSYINGHEAKLFTGLIDDINVDYSLDGFRIDINGSDYGKKLRNKRATLISVQDSADTKYRGSIIEYMAGQAGVTSVDAPQGSYTRIDHSFEDQIVLDMITKELVIDSYWWRFDEDGTLKIALDEIKTSTGTYPTPDWTYGEDRFIRLGLVTNDEGIINTLKILGTVYETKIEVDDPEDSPFGEYVTPTDSIQDVTLFNASKTLTLGEDILNWSASNTFNLEVHDGIRNVYGAFTQPHYWRGDEKYYYYTIDITWREKLEVRNYFIDCTDGLETYTKKKYGNLMRFVVRRYLDSSMQGKAGTISISLEGKWLNIQTSPEENPPTSAIIDNEEVDSPTYEYHYDQVAVDITDASSITKYGERKPNTEGTLEFPLAENIDQCEGIGRKIIRDSHKFMKQPDFEIPFNPMLKVGQTVSITDKKIEYSERWYVEEARHSIEQGKGRTSIGCVYYA